MAGFFITGTDTEIGKTFVSSLLIQFFVGKAYKAVGMKPVASGARKVGGVLQNEDALSLMQASNIEVEYKTVNPYTFEAAVSPHIAAEQAGVEIKHEMIKNNYHKLQQVADVVIVEGVGGWYAPISCHTTVADLAEALQLPVILVVGLRLGCLNHALLTAQALRQSGLIVAGWVANHIEEDFLSADKNIETLKHYLNDFPYLGSIPFTSNAVKSDKGTLILQNLHNANVLIEKYL
ncbi:MAG: dethiobiotin synthase [Gammaproteobacteria bacterium]|nr:dethiobiotin synthase [Gammaproteobacteria bacterium]MCW8987295.1 dethiobiotin synthase [Gammaproteobacteria bacterium]